MEELQRYIKQEIEKKGGTIVREKLKTIGVRRSSRE